MARTLQFDYSFNAAAKQVKIKGNVSFNKLLLINNVTRNTIIFIVGDSTLGASNVSYSPTTDETTVTLIYDTAVNGHSNNDVLQVYTEEEAVRFEPDEALLDPVHKLRVSQPNTLIDTDFEYGLQATKWESLERVNDVPSFYSALGDTPLTTVATITTVAGSNIVTVNTTVPHDLATGVAIDVRGVESITAEGAFIIRSIPGTSIFTYQARSLQTATRQIQTAYTVITIGRYYVGSLLKVDKSFATEDPVVTDEAVQSTLTVRTSYEHGFSTGSAFYLSNSVGNRQVTFDADSFQNGGAIDDRQVLPSSLSTTGTFDPAFPEHVGTTALTIPSTNIDQTTGIFTVNNHGMETGDCLVYTGWTNGQLQVQSLSPISAGALPTYSNSGTFHQLYVVKLDNNRFRITTRASSAHTGVTSVTLVSPSGGTSATFRIDRNSSGAIVGVQVVNGGSNYAVGNTLKIPGNFIGGLNNTDDLLLTVAALQTTFDPTPGSAVNVKSIAAVTPTNGTFANSSTTIAGQANAIYGPTLLNLTSNGGTGATHTFRRYLRFAELNSTRVSIFDWESGYTTTETVASVTVTNGGSGYDPATPPVVYFSYPTKISSGSGSTEYNGLPAQGIAKVNSSGVITSVEITFRGAGYVTTPTVYIAPPVVGGSQATATAALATTPTDVQLSRYFNKDAITTGAGSSSIFIRKHGFKNGQPLMFVCGPDNSPPGGLTDGGIYYVKNATEDTFQMSTSVSFAANALYGTPGTTLDLSSIPTKHFGWMQFHPGYQVKNFAFNAAEGGQRDRVLLKYAKAPIWVDETQKVVLKNQSGSFIPAGLIGLRFNSSGGLDTDTSNHEDMFTSTGSGVGTRVMGQSYYYIRSVDQVAGFPEYSLTTALYGSVVEWTSAATPGSNEFIAFSVIENQYSNSIYLQNHPFKKISQISGLEQYEWPQYRLRYFCQGEPGAADNIERLRGTYIFGGSINTTFASNRSDGSADFYAVPVTTDVIKLQKFDNNILPTSVPTVNFRGFGGSSTVNTHLFVSGIANMGIAIQNPESNRIYINNHGIGEGNQIRYNNNGNADVPGTRSGELGLENNNVYIAKDVTTNSLRIMANKLVPRTMPPASTDAGNDYFRFTSGGSATFTAVVASGAVTQVNVNAQGSGYPVPGTNRGEVIISFSGGGGSGATATATVNSSGNITGITVTNGGTLYTAAPTVTATGILYHGLRAGDRLIYNGGPSMVTRGPSGAGVSTGSVLFVIIVDPGTFQVAISRVQALQGYPIDITSGTSPSFTQVYSSIPLGKGSGTHTFTDVSPTGSVDGGYVAGNVTNNFLIPLRATGQVLGKNIAFNPEFTVNLSNGEFYVNNHGFITGTKVNYTAGTGTGIGLASNGPESGYSSLAPGTYYVIRKSQNYFALSRSKADAFAGLSIRGYSNYGSGAAHRLQTLSVYGESVGTGLVTLISKDITFNGSSSSVIAPATDRITFPGNHPFSTGDRVKYNVYAQGTAVLGLNNGQNYFVNRISNTVITLHNTWLGAYTNTERANISAVGTGTLHVLKLTNPTVYGTSYKGEWNATDTYIAHDVVLYQNNFYVARVGIPTTSRNITDTAAGSPIAANVKPVSDAGVLDNRWAPIPSNLGVATKFNAQFKQGDTLNIVNEVPWSTQYFDAASAVNTTENILTINNHQLHTGDAVFYRIDYDRAGSAEQRPIEGLTQNKLYYVNRVTANTITLFENPPGSWTGGQADTGTSYTLAINLVTIGLGSFHRLEKVYTEVYPTSIFSIVSDNQCIVDDPYPNRVVEFNPQGTVLLGTPTDRSNPVLNFDQDVFTIPNHGFVTGTKVYYSAGPLNDGFRIGTMVDGGTYYVYKIDDNSFKLMGDGTANVNFFRDSLSAVSGGVTQVNLTNSGQGFKHYFIGVAVGAGSYVTRTSGNLSVGNTNYDANNIIYTDQRDGGLYPGVFQWCQYLVETQLYTRPDAINLHRPFDGGVEISASESPNCSIVRQTRRYFRYQSGKGLQYSSAINFNPPIEVSGISYSSDTTTENSISAPNGKAIVVTRKPHKLKVGNQVKVQDVQVQSGSAAGYNATVSVMAVVDDFTFKYPTAAVPVDVTPFGFPLVNLTGWTDAKVRAGMYDDQNGMFFEYDGQYLYCVKRSSVKQIGGTLSVTYQSNTVSGVGTRFTKQLSVGQRIVIRGQSYKITYIASDTQLSVSRPYSGKTYTGVIGTVTEDERVVQSNWSVDKCNGTGKFGYVLDINKIQMAYMDYSWYGAGKVRFGFKDQNGRVIYVHEFLHNNKKTEAYLRSGNLPARYEVENGANPSYPPNLFHWGASVIMDGQFEDDRAYLFTAVTGSSGNDTLTIKRELQGQNIPILSLRLAPSVDSSLVGALGDRDLINRMAITLKQVGIVATNPVNNKPVSVKLILNGNLAQPYFSNVGAPSLTQIIKHTGTAADSVTGGIIVYEFRAASGASVSQELDELIQLGNSILGGDFVFPNGPDVLTVAVTPTDNPTSGQNTEVTARLTWSESQA